MYTVIKIMVRKNVADDELRKIAEQTVVEVEKDKAVKTNRISKAEFERVLASSEIDDRLSIRF